MLGTLDSDQIDRVLETCVVGRIGVHAQDRTYVVPVSYVYDGDSIYGHSADGLKIRMSASESQRVLRGRRHRRHGELAERDRLGTYEELKAMSPSR